ncbi:MAG: hypothetical protein ACYCVW_16490 [Rhodocyclaceae bacterium]
MTATLLVLIAIYLAALATVAIANRLLGYHGFSYPTPARIWDALRSWWHALRQHSHDDKR